MNGLTEVNQIETSDNITWSAHHTKKQRGPVFEVSITSLLPLLRNQVHSVATIRHVMDKIKDTVTYLNPIQYPVIAADRPIYVFAKQSGIDRKTMAKTSFVIMFGGLRIEMVALKSIGTLLQNSGWTEAIVEAGIAQSIPTSNWQRRSKYS